MFRCLPILLLVGCPSTQPTPADDTDAAVDSDASVDSDRGTGPNPQALATCTQMLGCAAVLFPTEFDDLVAAYDAGGSCWNSSVPDSQCAAACEDLLIEMGFTGGSTGCPDFTDMWGEWVGTESTLENDCPPRAWDPKDRSALVELTPERAPEVGVIINGYSIPESPYTCVMAVDGRCTLTISAEENDVQVVYGPLQGRVLSTRTTWEIRQWFRDGVIRGEWVDLDAPCHVTVGGELRRR